ncbi:MAG: hypothetical protein GXP62_07520 [Oligoflexia bacterium]|nr:hypothetical protein [Oligoflexia bacterium]
MIDTVDSRILDRILDRIQTAPTADNCQPWQVLVSDHHLRILEDPDRSRHILNSKGAISALSFGLLLEVCKIAAAEADCVLDARITVGGPTWLDGRIDPGSASPEDRALAPMLDRRTTDRRPFGREGLHHPVLDAVQGSAKGVRVAVTAPSDALVEYLVQADAIVWREPRIASDAHRWLRAGLLDPSEGLNPGNLGLPRPMSWLGAALPASPALMSLCGHLGGRALSGDAARRQLRDCSALVAFIVDEPGLDALVAVGRRALRVWLQLTAAGFGVQPFTMGSTLLHNQRAGLLPAGFRLPQAVASGHALSRQVFGLGPHQVLAWLFRTGPAPSLPKRLRTGRRSWASQVPGMPGAMPGARHC